MPAPIATQLPPFESYSDEGAVAFYLGDQAEAAAASADGVFVVEGCALPVHTRVLAPRLRVVAELAAFKAEHGTVPLLGGPCGYTLGVNGEHLDVLCSDQIPAGSERSLAGATLKRMAHFLRFAYDPAEVAAIDVQLPGAAKSLSACARLAHQMGGPGLLEALDLKMEAAVGSHQTVLHRLMDWVRVGEECGLKRLWAKCCREIAVTLARGRKGVGPRTASSTDLLTSLPGTPGPTDGMQTAVHDVLFLKDLSSRAKLAVMAMLLAGLRRAPACDPGDCVPPEGSLAAALALCPLPESPPSERSA